jgi:diguanylate cyclase (GGDEF)-like protein
MNYGYLLFHFHGKNYSLISIYAKILANSIYQAYSNSSNSARRKELLQENEMLNLKSKTDELTGILNRRGFYEYGEKVTSLSASMGKSGGILFFDLDGLKTINDTYGHKIGDLAIKLESYVIKTAFRESDVVGRLSGDEFGVVAPGFPSRKIDYLREKLIKLNEQISKENDLPFTLSISVGCVDFSPASCDFQALLKQADEKLYEEKRIKHSRR